MSLLQNPIQSFVGGLTVGYSPPFLQRLLLSGLNRKARLQAGKDIVVPAVQLGQNGVGGIEPADRIGQSIFFFIPILFAVQVLVSILLGMIGAGLFRILWRPRAMAAAGSDARMTVVHALMEAGHNLFADKLRRPGS